MANKNIKKYYTLIQKRNAIKTTLVPSHPSHNKNQETNDKFWQTCKAKWTLPHSSGGREIDPATTEICAKVPPKLKNKAFHMILLRTILGYTHKGIKASSSWKYLHTHICCRQAVESAYVLTNKWINEYLLCLADKKRKGSLWCLHTYLSLFLVLIHPPTCPSTLHIPSPAAPLPHQWSPFFCFHAARHHYHLLLPTASQGSSCLTSYTHTCLNRDSTCDRLWLFSYSTMIFSCIQLTVNVITTFFFKAGWNSTIRTGHTVFTYLLIGI